jgi:CheY-like chemotaxis protein
MTKEQVDQLFEEYSRFNMDANRTTEGTGLGMSITRNLLRLMNGEISVESESGKGSTFTIRLSQGKVGSNVLGKEMADNLHNFRTSSRTQMKRVQITRDPMPYGSVLIVDDVETNIYVARGLLLPYELQIDSVDSGFAAIDRVKNGNEYDIIFMDHMMPKMDGIEATKLIRDMGYHNPIVALTANAVSGQADIFLGNGFDDFISKPIDIRQLNTILNKMIRDKYPDSVVQGAINNAAEIKQTGATTEIKDPKFIEVFLRDAIKSLAVLDVIEEKGSYDNDEDLRTYIIHVHGIKSALANIGNMELSAVALKLEMTARDNEIKIIQNENPAFLGELREFVESLMTEQEKDKVDTPEGDPSLLHEKLLVIKTACEEYDENLADNILTELREKTWPQNAEKFLSSLAEYLLHSDFDLVIEETDKYLETLEIE